MQTLEQPSVEASPKLFSRILVPVDFSEHSRRAFLNAVGLALRFDLQTYLAHIITNAPECNGAAASASAEASRQAAENQLHELAGSIGPEAPAVTTLLEEGQLWDAVDRLVQRYKIDLVVLGTRGHGHRPQPLLGSGAEQIFRHATCPVLTIGPPAAQQDLSQIQFRSILFVTDFGPSAERAANYAILLAGKYGARFTVLHVVEDSGATSRLELDHLRQIHVQHMRQSLHAVDRTFVPSEFSVHFGNAADEILRAAEETAADLIVMGAKAGSGWAGHVPLSTAYSVVARAQCPVLSVRAGRPHSHYVSSPSD